MGDDVRNQLNGISDEVATLSGALSSGNLGLDETYAHMEQLGAKTQEIASIIADAENRIRAAIEDRARTAQAAYESGKIGWFEYQREMNAAKRETKDLENATRVTASALQGLGNISMGSLNGQINSVISSVRALQNAADNARNSLTELGRAEQRRMFRDADAESMRNYEAGRDATDGFIRRQREINSLTSEEIRLQAEVATIRQEAANAGGFLTEARARELALENFAAEERRRNEAAGPKVERKPSGGGGGGAAATQPSNIDQALKSIQEQTRALELEALALVMAANAGEEYGRAIEIARREAELLVAAERDGVEVTDQLRASISEAARAYADAEGSVRGIREEMEEANRRQQEFVDALRGGFVGLLSGAQTFDEALAGIARRLAEMAANKVFDMLLAPLLGGIKLPGFAEGGYTGDGGKYEPKGVVHGGEFVMSKAATDKIGVNNLEALHNSALKGYANGGYVGTAAKVATGSNGAGAVSNSIEINAPVTVNATGGTPEQNADLGDKVARAVESQMRGIVRKELLTQMRPGGMLR